MEPYPLKASSFEGSSEALKLAKIGSAIKEESYKRLSEQLFEEVLPVPLPDSAELKDVTTTVLEKIILPHLL